MADIDPTFYEMQNEMKESGAWQGDMYRAIYNLYQAIRAICNNLDEDAGVLGADYDAYIRTPLEAAMSSFMKTPRGTPTQT